MRLSSLDHLVVVAPSLAAGAAFVERKLGVKLQAGGRHPRMGTHNLLLRLGASYLEVIVPDPDAPAPSRPRWFGLDTLSPDTLPHLAHWVARTSGLDDADAGLTGVFGAIESMSRGTLAWRISIRSDGHLPLEGAIPSLIDWGDATHPAQRLDDLGCTLQRLAITHPDPALVRRHLATIGFCGPLTVLPGERCGLSAAIETAAGCKTL